MELADILDEESVLFCTDIKTKRDILERLAKQASKRSGHSAEEIFEALSDRESLGSTGLGNGIAVPHGKFAGLKGVVAVFMKLSVPVDFENSVDDQPVDLVMMLLAPMGSGADHLKALARVARVLRTDSVADSLRRANDPKRMYSILTQPLETHKAA